MGVIGRLRTVKAAGIVENTDDNPTISASTIANGTTLDLSGNNTNNILLDKGSLENSGILNLGSDAASYTASFNGTLSTTSTGTTNVLSAVTFTSLDNDGTLNLAGGANDADRSTLSSSITGSGTTNFTGFVSNAHTISNAVNVAANANFTNTGTVSNTLTNAGTTTTALENVGAVTNTGSLYVSDATINESIVGAGTTYLTKETAFGEDTNIAGTLHLSGHTITMQDTAKTFSTAQVGTLTGTGELKIDVSLDGSDKNDVLNMSGGDATLTLSSVNIVTGGADNALTYLTGALDGLTVNVGTTGTLVASDGVQQYTFTKNGNGSLTVTQEAVSIALAEFIAGTGQGDIASLSLDTDNAITTPLTTGGRATLDLYLNNGADLTGSANNGITVAGGYNFSIDGSADAQIKGFNTALTNEGTLNVKGITFTGNTTDINNTGILNMNGTNELQKIIGAGNVNIQSGSTTVDSITQDAVTVVGGAELHTNIAGMTVNSLANAGTLNLDGGADDANRSTLSSSITGGGTTYFTGFVSSAQT